MLLTRSGSNADGKVQPVRIAYGVFGYGRGHATRTAAVLPELVRRHSVLVFAGGEAYETLANSYPVVRIPTLGYRYRGDRRSNYLTIRHNVWHLLDIAFGGPTTQAVLREMQDFRPDVVISDAEPWTQRVARRLRVPRISFDHFGVMAYCRLPMPLLDRIRSIRDVAVYRWMMRGPQRMIVSSFYDAPPARDGVQVVGPMLRDEVLQARPVRGQHLLVYLNNGAHQFSPAVERALREVGVPALIYGTPRRGADGNLDFRPLSNLPFVEDLATCRAVISTAGNQLMGEALHLGKPMLVMPEDCVEQRLNAKAVERLGIGVQVRASAFNSKCLQAFLEREGEFLVAIRAAARDGRREAVETIERFLTELVPVLGEASAALQGPHGGERPIAATSTDAAA